MHKMVAEQISKSSYISVDMVNINDIDIDIDIMYINYIYHTYVGLHESSTF